MGFWTSTTHRVSGPGRSARRVDFSARPTTVPAAPRRRKAPRAGAHRPKRGAALPESTVRHDDLANAIRALAMDAVEKAKSGHPGMPMGMADVATVLWTKFLKFDPAASALARPRPLRAVGRPRLDAALRAALPDRLPGHDDRGAASASASSARARPATPSTATPSASRPRPGRSARAWPTRSAWRWPSATSPPASAPTWSTTTPTSSPATADLMEGISHEAGSLAGH